MRVSYSPRWWHFFIVLPALLFVGLGIWDQLSRYLSWRNLTKDEIAESANWYIENRTSGGRACLYAVVCENDRARLELVKDLERWDLDAAKSLVWDRKFGDRCPGRTANFALEMVQSGDGSLSGSDRAVWSFYNDRFVPIQRRYDGSSFSETDAEPCTEEFVITK